LKGLKLGPERTWAVGRPQAKRAHEPTEQGTAGWATKKRPRPLAGVSAGFVMKSFHTACDVRGYVVVRRRKSALILAL